MEIQLEVVSKTESKTLSNSSKYSALLKLYVDDYEVEGFFTVGLDKDGWEELIVGQVLNGEAI